MLEIRRLSKVFVRRGVPFQAVNDLSLCVRPGEVYGMLGANGAGKTTTLRMVLGLTEPTSGDALLGGVSVRQNPTAVKERVGLVTSSGGLYPWLSVDELLDFFADAYNVPDGIRQERIGALRDQFGLNDIRAQRCGSLSTGQKQRVLLARALVHDPPFVLLDEPTRGLDVVGSRALFDFVRGLRARQKAILFCTHRLDEAERLCDCFGLLHRGSLRMEGTLDALRQQTGKQAIVDIMHDLITADGLVSHHPDSPGMDGAGPAPGNMF